MRGGILGRSAHLAVILRLLEVRVLERDGIARRHDRLGGLVPHDGWTRAPRADVRTGAARTRRGVGCSTRAEGARRDETSASGRAGRRAARCARATCAPANGSGRWERRPPGRARVFSPSRPFGAETRQTTVRWWSMQREVTLKAAATSLEADPRARRPASRAVPPRRELARPRPLGRPLSGSVTSRPRTSRSSPRFGRVVVARGFAPGRGASSLERPVRARVSGISPDASSAAASRPRVAGASPRRPRAPTWPPSARSGTCSARR